MEEHSVAPGIRKVTTTTNGGEGCHMIGAFIHHELPLEDMEKIARTVELMLPSLIRLAATL